ncbi:MAG TPA: hypothetical protein VNZ64_12905 [Candidatus Acidoferrum sp.]|jgi:hypothetical protein|nr:hypothetical protein [Candidatus Acidoferrum sp.]
MKSAFAYWFCIVAGCAAVTPAAQAAQVWTGPLTTFTLASGADPTQAVNQDRITANVWITRDTYQGIYNAKTETLYTAYFSPADTEWAYGTLANYASLTYTNWQGWNSKTPTNTIGLAAVLHLISDNIYLSVEFTSWGSRGAGGFSYLRSTPAPPAPAPPQLSRCSLAGQGLQFEFTNTPGFTFTVLGSTNVLLPITNWLLLGTVTDTPPGSGLYRFTDAGTITNADRRCYRVRWP